MDNVFPSAIWKAKIGVFRDDVARLSGRESGKIGDTGAEQLVVIFRRNLKSRDLEIRN